MNLLRGSLEVVTLVILHLAGWNSIAQVDSRLSIALRSSVNVSKGAKIRNRYNQVPHLIQDTNEKVTNSQLDTTNESQEVSPFPAGDHKARINRRVQRHSIHKTEKNIKDSQKKYRLGTVSKIFPCIQCNHPRTDIIMLWPAIYENE